MAITFGNSGKNTSQGDTSISANNNGDYLIVGVEGTANTLTAVTYNGVGLTQIGTTLNNVQSGRYLSMWGLLNPTAGTNNIALTGSANQNVAWASISGINQSTPISGTNTASATSSTAAVSVTTTINNAYIVGWSIIRDFSSLGTNTSILQASANAVSVLYRTTTAITPAGASSLTVNTTGGDWNFIATGLNPVVAATSGNFFQLL